MNEWTEKFWYAIYFMLKKLLQKIIFHFIFHFIGLAQADVFDDGMLTHKEHLPVMELRFGDTGTLNDEKWGEHTLGPLRCYGDRLFENVVTFRKQDATIDLPTFEAATSGDIRFEFKTTQENGIFLQNTGTYHFIEVKLVCEYTCSLFYCLIYNCQGLYWNMGISIDEACINVILLITSNECENCHSFIVKCI